MGSISISKRKRLPRRETKPEVPIVEYLQNIATDKKLENFIALRFRSVSGKRDRIIIPRADVGYPARIVDALNNAAAALPLDRKEATEMVKAALKVGAKLPDARITDQVGWLENDHYVTPHQTFSAGKPAIRHRADYMGTAVSPASGTLRGWKKAVEPVGEKSALLVFALGIGLAGPILDLLPARTGIAFNFSGSSGAGKSTLIAAAQSVARRAGPSDLVSLELTPTFLEETGWAHCDQILCLDEFGAARTEGKQLSALLAKIAFSVRDGKGANRSEAGKRSAGQSGLTFVSRLPPARKYR